MPHSRARDLAVLLTLVCFVGWLGVGWFHHHPQAATCEICKALHASKASLPSRQSTPGPTIVSRILAQPSLDRLEERWTEIPRTRAPPLS